MIKEFLECLHYIFDKPVLYSELSANGETRNEIAKRLLDRCNELGKMNFDKQEEVNVDKNEAGRYALNIFSRCLLTSRRKFDIL